jgi:hypothetical protein
MGILGLAARTTILAVLVASPFGALAPAPARADDSPSTVRLALAAAPATGNPLAIDAPAAPTGDAPTATAPSTGSPWWVWALIGAGVAGVAALVLVSSGSFAKDPSCPADRNCM